MTSKEWKREIFTIPNLLSIFRLILIPIYVIIYIHAESDADYYLAGGILAVSCLTDMIDGKIARHFNMISTLGKILDPIADKATQFTLLICLAIEYPVLRFLAVLFVVKESFQLIAGGISWKKGKMLKGALLAGKICTTVLFVSLIVLVMFPKLSPNAVLIISVVDIIFMVVAFVDYIIAYLKKGDCFQSIHDENK